MSEIDFTVGTIKPIEIYKEAWAMIKDQYWVIFAVTIIGLMIGGLIPIIIAGPMVAGIYLVLLRVYEGQRADFGLLFKGFEFFGPTLILMVIVTVPIIVLVFVIYIPMIMMAFAGQRISESELMWYMIGVFAVELVMTVIMVVVHSLLIFSFPLIVDKKLSAAASIKLSIRAVMKNLSGVAGFFGVGFVVVMVGYLMLCVGLYLVLPLVFAANVVLYRKVFPSKTPPIDVPPASGAYRFNQ